MKSNALRRRFVSKIKYDLNMKKILISLAIIGLVGGIVSGMTWALYSDQGIVAGNTFTTGTADLEIRGRNPNTDWGSDVKIDFKDWNDLYPGWERSYKVQLKNASSSPIALDVIPHTVIKSDPSSLLRNVLTMQFYEGDEPRGPEQTLAEWIDNDHPIEYLAHSAAGKTWTVKFRFPLSDQVNNALQNRTIKFDLIFDGIQQPEAPVVAITNITQGTTHSSINGAITAANDGDTIIVPEGEYGDGSSEVVINKNNLSLISDTSYWGRALLKGRITVNAAGTTIEGFDIWFSGSDNKPPIDLSNVNGITIRDNKIRESNNDQAGINCWTGPANCYGDILIEHNEITKGNVAGLYVYNNKDANIIIRHNTSIKPGTEGIWAVGLSRAHLVIEDNIVVEAGTYGIKIVDEPLSINGVKTNRCQKLLDDNPGVENAYLEWADYTCSR